MMLDFNEPVLQIYITPFLVSALSVGLLRFFLGPWRGTIFGTLAIGIGFLAAFLLMNGVDLWPVTSLSGILPWVVLGGMTAGALLGELDEPEVLANVIYIALPLGVGFWVGFVEFGDTVTMAKTVVLAITIIVGFWSMRRMRNDGDSGPASPIAAMTALVGFVIAFGGPDESLGKVSLALAMAIAGYAVWNWPKYRFPWGAAGSLSVGAALTVLFGTWAVTNELADVIPAALAFLAFLVFPIIERNLDLRPAAQPLVQIVLSLIPIAAVAGAMSALG